MRMDSDNPEIGRSLGSSMEFDTFTVSLLEARADSAKLSQPEADALQDAHMDLLASLHEAGKLEAAGPFLSPKDRSFRGMCLHRIPPEEVSTLFEKDPLIRAGRLSVQVFAWAVPKGAIALSPTRFPHSQAEL